MYLLRWSSQRCYNLHIATVLSTAAIIFTKNDRFIVAGFTSFTISLIISYFSFFLSSVLFFKIWPISLCCWLVEFKGQEMGYLTWVLGFVSDGYLWVYELICVWMFVMVYLVWS